MPGAAMIEDTKLRELFKAESEEHLQHLDDALLRLEKTPTDQALLEEAFREAHSLKGEMLARMTVDLVEIRRLAFEAVAEGGANVPDAPLPQKVMPEPELTEPG